MSFENCPSKKSIYKELSQCLSIAKEYAKGLLEFRKIGPCITIYGSARLQPESKYYEITVELANKLAKDGFSVMTGGGPGIMQAANKGAFESGLGKSAGCSIYIPYEKYSNPFLNFHHHCNFFFIRKVLLTRYSAGFIALPGGFGTLDELFEMLTLIKTERMNNFPVILIGVTFWQPLLDYITETMIPFGTVSQEEISCITLTDDVTEAVKIINDYCHEH